MTVSAKRYLHATAAPTTGSASSSTPDNADLRVDRIDFRAEEDDLSGKRGAGFVGQVDLQPHGAVHQVVPQGLDADKTFRTKPIHAQDSQHRVAGLDPFAAKPLHVDHDAVQRCDDSPPPDLFFSRQMFVLLDLQRVCGDLPFVFGLFFLQHAPFDDQPQTVHFGIGDAFRVLVDGFLRASQLRLGHFGGLLGETDIDVVFRVLSRDLQFDRGPLLGNLRFGVDDLGQKIALLDRLAFAHVDARQHTRLPGRHVDLLDQFDQHRRDFDLFARPSGIGARQVIGARQG